MNTPSSLLRTLVAKSLFLLVMATSAAHAEGLDVILKSVGGTQIGISSEKMPLNGNTIASARVMVDLRAGSDLNCSSKAITAVLVTYCGGQFFGKTDLLLTPESRGGSCHFASYGAAIIPSATHAGVCTQEIAITADDKIGGDWLVDPVTGKHNFQYSVQK